MAFVMTYLLIGAFWCILNYAMASEEDNNINYVVILLLHPLIFIAGVLALIERIQKRKNKR